MFASIARRYDLLNSLLSLRRDRAWRRFTVSQCRMPSSGLALDVATGTGDLARELARRYAGATVVGVDFSPNMLALARTKLESDGRIHLLLGDALHLPFPDNTFDCATIAFGLRNVASLSGTFSEMARVVKPGGRVVSLELTRPRSPMVRAFFRIYMLRVVPLVGGLISGKRSAYIYLPRSVFRFSTPEEVKDIMQQVGLRQVELRSLSLGLVTVHTGRKG